MSIEKDPSPEGLVVKTSEGKELTSEQSEMASKSELIVDNVKLGMGGSKKEIHGFVTIKGRKFFVRFEETKEEDPTAEPNYTGSILGDRDEKGDEYWKQLEGAAAKKFFEFYAPISKPRIDFEKSSDAPKPKVEDPSIEDELLGK